MSDYEKINIYVPEYIGSSLDYDANVFEIVKSNGQDINRNRLLSRIIIGYHNIYTEEFLKKQNTIMEILSENSIDFETRKTITDRLMKKVLLPEVPVRKGKHPSRLSLKPTKETEGIILNITNELMGDDYISQFFCRMLISYCSKPIYLREQIVFSDNYESLICACSKKKTITFSNIWNPQRLHEVIPYRLVISHEEMFNYLLCAEINPTTGEQEAKSYRLSRVKHVFLSKNSAQITPKIQNFLERMIKEGPQYAINDDEEACVRLTDSGRRSFSRIYFGRPTPDRIVNEGENHYYYFTGSKDQLYLYFRRFSYDEAEVLSPNSLRQRMEDFHTKANHLYTTEGKK